MSKHNRKQSKRARNMRATADAAARDQALAVGPPSNHPTADIDHHADERHHKRSRLTMPEYRANLQAVDQALAWSAGDDVQPAAQEVGEGTSDEFWHQWVNLGPYLEQSEIEMSAGIGHHASAQEPAVAGSSRLPSNSDHSQQGLPLPGGQLPFADLRVDWGVFEGMSAEEMFRVAPQNSFFVGAENGSMGLHQTMGQDPILANDPSMYAHWSLPAYGQAWGARDGSHAFAAPDQSVSQALDPHMAEGDEPAGIVSSTVVGDSAVMSPYPSIDASSTRAGSELTDGGINDGRLFYGFGAPQRSADAPSLAGEGYAWEFEMLALPEGILLEDSYGAIGEQDASPDTSLQEEEQSPAVLGHDVQEHNIIIPPAQSQPSGSASPRVVPRGRQPCPIETRETISEGHDMKRQNEPLGNLACNQCDKKDLSEEALRRHKERYHNKFRENFGKRFPCFLCGDASLTTSPELYGRHREGSEVQQCAVTLRLGGDFGKLMKFLVERELARGKEGRGLECLNHWQFGAGRGRYMPALCREWAAERARQGPLWQALTGKKYDDKVPMMGLVVDSEAAAGQPPMKWAKGVYQPGKEPKPKKPKKGKDAKPAKGTKRKRGE